MEAVAIQAPQEEQKSDGVRRLEPAGLVISRGDGEAKRVANLVPHAVVVGGDNAKAVILRRKIRVERLAAIADVLPVAIEAFQSVFEMDLLRRDEVERRVIDPEIAAQFRQAQI